MKEGQPSDTDCACELTEIAIGVGGLAGLKSSLQLFGFVAAFLGRFNCIPARVNSAEDEIVVAETGFVVSGTAAPWLGDWKHKVGDRIMAIIHPARVVLEQGGDKASTLHGTWVERPIDSYDRISSIYVKELGKTIRISVPDNKRRLLNHSEVEISIPREHLFFLPSDE